MYKSWCMSFLCLSSIFAFEIQDIDGDWQREAIDKQLECLHDLDLTYQTIKNYPRTPTTYLYEIQGNHLTVTPDAEFLHENLKGRQQVLIEAINAILTQTALPDMAFLVDIGDARFLHGEEEQMPVFVFSRKKDCHSQILLPCWESFNDIKQGGRLAQARQNSYRHQWKSKRAIAFWRGSTTGYYPHDDTQEPIFQSFGSARWKELPRAQLVLAAQASKGKVNAKFTNYCQGDSLYPEVYDILGKPVEYCSMNKHLCFKYLIDIDGNSYGTRLEWAMASNCAPMRVEGHWQLWYYDGIEPFIHYIPVKGDCSDLIEKVDWAREHDWQAYKIARNSAEFASKYFTKDAVYTYVYHLLLTYSNLISD